MFHIGKLRGGNTDMKKFNRKVINSQRKWLMELTGTLFLHSKTVVSAEMMRGRLLSALPSNVTCLRNREKGYPEVKVIQTPCRGNQKVSSVCA